MYYNLGFYFYSLNPAAAALDDMHTGIIRTFWALKLHMKARETWSAMQECKNMADNTINIH